MSVKFYNNIYKFFSKLVRKVYRVEITGAENEPAEGAFIACVNHLSFQDVVITAAVMKRQVTFLAKAELFKIPLLGGFITAMGAIPLKRGGGDISAIKKTMEALNEGKIVGFYPQGHRCPGVHPKDTEIKNGLGLLEWRCRAPVLPIAVVCKNFKIRPFRKTKFIIGKPVLFEEFNMTAANPEEYKRISKIAFDKILELIE